MPCTPFPMRACFHPFSSLPACCMVLSSYYWSFSRRTAIPARDPTSCEVDRKQVDESQSCDARPCQGNRSSQDTQDALEEQKSPPWEFRVPQGSRHGCDSADDGKHAKH